MKNILFLTVLMSIQAVNVDAQIFHKFEAASGGALNNAANTVYYTPTAVAQSSVAGYT